MATTIPVAIEALPNPPTDGVTKLSYLPATSASTSLLASSSWDGSVRIHDTLAKTAVLSHGMDSGPLLSLAAPAGANNIVTGGLDGSIRSLDISKSIYQVLGRHTGDSPSENEGTKVACSCLGVFNDIVPTGGGLVVSAGWDSRLHLWDSRQKKAAATLKLPGKAFSMDVDSKHHRVVVATAGRRICFIDTRKPEAEDNTDSVTADLVLDRESSLKYQTRTVRYFPDGTGIALGSVEGRVAVEYLEELGVPTERKKYAFKCHRSGDIVYPVNCIDFHPRFGTFATGGCDGTVVVWDGINKKKLTSLPPFATSIAALAFNHDGTELAVASSYTFEEGEREHPRDEIFVRSMADAECLPKTVTS